MSKSIWMGRICLSAMVAVLSACSDGQAQKQKTLQGIVSWTASAEMIIDARASGLVPQAYSGLAIQRCQQEVATLAESLRGDVPKPVQQIQSQLARGGRAASQGDQSLARQSVEALRQARAQIRAGMKKG